MNTLKPCPFCGCEVKFESTGWDHPMVRINHPESDCIAFRLMRWYPSSASRREREMLIEGWNRRVGE